jgi:tartrate-resistant acid phosphatase type 5
MGLLSMVPSCRRASPDWLPKLWLGLLFVPAAACEKGCSGRGVESRPDPPAPVIGSPAASANAPAFASLPAASSRRRSADAGPVTRFAIIGDFGVSADTERHVAELVRAEQPDFIITLGDNNYPVGAAETIDANIGRFYSDFIHPYAGRYGKGASENRFFPSLGNHDWYTANAKAYLDYFTLPGNERYYDFVRGDVHFFAIDSDEREPDGIESESVQARWLERQLKASKSAWQVVYMHHPPYSSGRHGSSTVLRWPYGAWGADLVLAGHDHHYEHLQVGGVTYLVNGLGGQVAYGIGPGIEGSRVRYNQRHGAQFAEANASELVVRFVNIDRKLVDEVVLRHP